MDHINKVEAAAALTFVAIGTYVVAEAYTYPMGTATAMGPGYVPRILGSLLVMLGIATLVQARNSKLRLPQISIRSSASVLAAIAVFALLIRPAGLLPAAFGLAIVSSFAEVPFRPVKSLLNGVVICAIAYAIFIWALGLPLRAFGA
jgi:hypothetical protein